MDLFGCDVNHIFDLLLCYKSVQEIAKDLAPKIKTLQANLEIIQQIHDMEDLHSVSLTQHLIQNIMRSLPVEARSSFNNQYMEFRGKDPAKVRPPATFLFLAQYVIKLEKNYQANHSLFELNLSPLNVGIKPVRYGSPGYHSKTPHPSSSTSPQGPHYPCALCTSKGLESNHFALNYRCSVAKLSSPDILQIILDTKECPSCDNVHEPPFQCNPMAHPRCALWDVNTMEFLSTDARPCTVTTPHPLPSPSWDQIDLFPWLNL